MSVHVYNFVKIVTSVSSSQRVAALEQNSTSSSSTSPPPKLIECFAGNNFDVQLAAGENSLMNTNDIMFGQSHVNEHLMHNENLEEDDGQTLQNTTIDTLNEDYQAQNIYTQHQIYENLNIEPREEIHSENGATTSPENQSAHNSQENINKTPTKKKEFPYNYLSGYFASEETDQNSHHYSFQAHQDQQQQQLFQVQSQRQHLDPGQVLPKIPSHTSTSSLNDENYAQVLANQSLKNNSGDKYNQGPSFQTDGAAMVMPGPPMMEPGQDFSNFYGKGRKIRN